MCAQEMQTLGKQGGGDDDSLFRKKSGFRIFGLLMIDLKNGINNYRKDMEQYSKNIASKVVHSL